MACASSNFIRVITASAVMVIFLSALVAPSCHAYWGGRGRGSSLALAKRFEGAEPYMLGDDEYNVYDPMERRLAFTDTSSYLPVFRSSLAKRSSKGMPSNSGSDSKPAGVKFQWKR